jgi:hypothetical protein
MADSFDVDEVELIQGIETALGQIAEGKGIAHSEAHQRLKSKYSKRLPKKH